eukprot:6201858-Pleurochrysis_carterae.AAC.3
METPIWKLNVTFVHVTLCVNTHADERENERQREEEMRRETEKWVARGRGKEGREGKHIRRKKRKGEGTVRKRSNPRKYGDAKGGAGQAQGRSHRRAHGRAQGLARGRAEGRARRRASEG